MDIGIIGAGPAGVIAAITAKRQNPDFKVSIFDKASALSTLLYTGNGRCNLTYAEFDFKELASFYPRGEKFLYSVFSNFDVSSTFEFFENEGIELFVQEDKRVFPKSNRASDVRNLLLGLIKKYKIKIINDEVIDVEKKQDKFKIHTYSRSYDFDKVVISTGGRHKSSYNGFEFAKNLGHKITALYPCLCGFSTKEKWVEKLSGVAIENVGAKVNNKEFCEDLLFTHDGISGPLTFKISSFLDVDNCKVISLNFLAKSFEDFDKELVEDLNSNSKKDISNILSQYLPKSLVEVLLKEYKIENKKAFEINSYTRKKIVEVFTNLKLSIKGVGKKGEMVTKGGVFLNEINPKTMESKIIEGLFFAGEVLDINGLTGGFNLQACFSTGYVAGKNI